MFLIRGLLGRLIMLAVLVVVAGGAAWWFFVREENSVQESTSDVTDEVRQAAEQQKTPSSSATSSAGSGSTPAANLATGTSTLGSKTYRIIEGQSEAWYLAPEKLAQLPTKSTAKGTTKEVSGEFHFTESGLDPAKPTKFTVGLTKLQSDQSRRDGRVQSALETSKYPSATFTATKLTGMPAEFTATESVMQLTGTMDLHGVQKELTWELKVKRDGDILSGLATVTFKYSDFGINKPDIAGMVSVDEDVTIQVQLFAQES